MTAIRVRFSNREGRAGGTSNAVERGVSTALGPGNTLLNLLLSPPVNAGTYYVSARFAGNANYKPAQATTPKQIVINKATPRRRWW